VKTGIVALIGIVIIIGAAFGVVAVCVAAGYPLAGAGVGFIVMLLGSKILSSVIKAL
jgi:hypothetical protein